MKWQDQLSINFWKIYSWFRCRKFELRNKLDKLRSATNVEVYINGIFGRLDSSKIKYQDGFTSNDKSRYNLCSSMGTQYKSGDLLGKWEPKNVVWDKNTSMQLLVTPESGDCTKQEAWDGPYHYDYKAGYMDTFQKATFDKGWFHAKVKLTHNKSFWPAWWLLGDRKVKDESEIVPEFDIYEEMDNRLSFSVHLDYSKDHLKHCTSSLKFNTAEWFIMSLHWTDKFIKWYVNGYLVKTYKLKLADYVHKPHWFIFNDSYKGDVSKLTGKEGTKIDWVIVADENVDFGFDN